MTNSRQRPNPPTPGQISYLRDLALKTGGSFAWPKTFDEAGKEIVRLKKTRPTDRTDRQREKREIARDMATRCGDSARVREDETDGYGSSARWS